MNTVVVPITNETLAAFSTAIALIVPLFIIAILVDSSRDAPRIGPSSEKQSPDKYSIWQSRRTLLAMVVGISLELISLLAILTSPSGDKFGPVLPLNYSNAAFEGFGLLVLLYMMVIPHVRLHISNIRNQPSSARWTVVVGWLFDFIIIVAALVQRFIGEATANFVVGYILLGLALMITGAMITLTVTTVRRKSHDEEAAGNGVSSQDS